jgi:hypothetical protein
MPILNMIYWATWWGGWWQPWANTIAYFPLDTDKSNTVSGSSIALSTSTTTISTIWWVSCLYCDWTQSQTMNIGFRTEDVGSVMFWYYSTDNSWVRTFIGQNTWPAGRSDERSIVFFSWTILRYARAENGGTSYDVDATLPTANQWHCIGITEWSWWAKFFIDGVQVGTDSNSLAFSQCTVNTWVWCTNDRWSISRQFKGYMSKIVLNDSDISLADYLDFYNKTKWDYWIL